ncbi:prolyl-tRNA synthetase [Lysobacter daejeonensis GH1-9]|uniref:Prolyl-tRNA synthetase n=1 Tax=Lysobacter daejeonensis GH1-9 TaxID=1385517 RepID=A0A0A0F085_9GAMM|nr:YbaK/EbsC family protein [Lysobacter daejeonensis]KGM55703.1 prolyl-tRNA synthetase [Lysobacter daejeonensis GH1-9]
MTTQRLEQYLRSHDVAFDTLPHDHAITALDVARRAHLAGKDVAKTVMVKVDGRLAMAVMPANEWLSLERMRQACGAKSVALANESEFIDRFPECEVGAMPPFGNLYGMDVYAADTLSHEHDIAFNAGSHDEVVRMGWNDYERLVHPRIMSMTRH